MSDAPVGHLRYHEIDIPARFVRQASEHIDHTQARWITFIFTGENTEDAVCVGVTTRLMIADQRPRMRPPQPGAPEQPEPTAKKTTKTKTRKKPSAAEPKLKDITDDLILSVISQEPASTAEICNALGVPTSNVAVRQKIWRIVTKLGEAGVLRREGEERNAKWRKADGANGTADAATNEPRMPVRPARRHFTRQQISEDMVLDQMRNGHLTSKSVSDAIGLPRADASLRGRVTEHLRNLKEKGRISRTDKMTSSGPIYELHDESSMAAEG